MASFNFDVVSNENRYVYNYRKFGAAKKTLLIKFDGGAQI